MPEIPKAYDPKDVEDKIYKKWEESGMFNPDNFPPKAGPPGAEGLHKHIETFSIAMPPPNVTGILHLGHALENTLMDTMIRYQRMQGKRALLVPGTDHAAVATQAKVEKDLVKSGKYKNPREELGREKLLEIIREYSEKSKATILSQIRKMGTSCDWSRLAYTFDEPRSRAVNEVFTRMYRDGLIYRGYRVINWSVKGQSTCSDDELVYVERPAKLYTFKYSKDFPISIATTRPETKLGDTAVAVNPKDARYKKYIGQIFTVDIGAEKPLQIKIIGDNNVDSTFGTGALGVTPAHSMVDYEMAQKNKLSIIKVIGEDGKMTTEAGKNYAGLTVFEAREKFVEQLRYEGLLEKEEDIMQNVGTSDRFGDIVEVLPMTQWFVDVNKKIPGTPRSARGEISKKKSLKDLMRDAVTIGHNGDKKQKVKITPDRFEKIYLHWIDNLRDWCISRQIWWGHRIPVWYRNKLKVQSEKLKVEDNINNSGNQEIYVGIEPPPASPSLGGKGEGWTQDPDTLDTWFSSGTWTFSILGWPTSAKATAGKPEKTKDLKDFHPTSWMQMGSEIIFFWMARMILMSTYAIDQIPFKDVYIHGILRDKDGRKFSKSLGNGIDPLEIIKTYGTDALRMSLLIGNTPGNDARFYEEKVEGYRNFVNKLWNISRFILTSDDAIDLRNIKDTDIKKLDKKKLTLADKWILSKISELVKLTTKNLDNYNFSQAGEDIGRFMRDDFADWYLEIAKIESKRSEADKRSKSIILIFCLKNLLKLLHPFTPFVTEEIWQKLKHAPNPSQEGNNMLMTEKWPEVFFKADKKDAKNFEFVRNIITAIRALRADNKIDPALKIKAVFIAGSSLSKKILESESEIIKGLARLAELSIEIKKIKIERSISAIAEGVEIYLPLEGAVDIKKELERIDREIKENESAILDFRKRLDNEAFVFRAKKEVVEETRARLKASEESVNKLQDRKKTLLS